jgi:hypothetical protein
MVEALKAYKTRTEQTFAHYSCWTMLRHTRQWADHLHKPKMLVPLKRKPVPDEPSEPADDLLIIPSASHHPHVQQQQQQQQQQQPQHQHHHHQQQHITSQAGPSSHPTPQNAFPLDTGSLNISVDRPPASSNTTNLLLPADASSSSSTTASPQQQQQQETNALNEKRLNLIAELVASVKRKNELLAELNQLERETNQIKIMSQFSSHESELWFKLKQQEILNQFNLNILS